MPQFWGARGVNPEIKWVFRGAGITGRTIGIAIGEQRLIQMHSSSKLWEPSFAPSAFACSLEKPVDMGSGRHPGGAHENS